MMVDLKVIDLPLTGVHFSPEIVAPETTNFFLSTTVAVKDAQLLCFSLVALYDKRGDPG